MSEAFIKKNTKLSLEFDDYLSKHPDLFEAIPNGAYIVIAVQEDNQFNAQSLSLIRDRRHKKIVEARKVGASWHVQPLQLTTA